jgi:cardiolipin synthase
MMLNIPNALTLLRALGVPAFLYTFLVLERPILSFTIIAIGALTDYLDGKIARALNQTSEFGAKFDPAVDRFYIAAVIIALAVKEFLPWWLVISIIARDLILLMVVILQRLRGVPYLSVSYLGKAATFNLLYAFPFLLLEDVSVIGPFCYLAGWAFAIWGVSLYFYTGIEYLIKGIKSSIKGR